MRRRLNFYKLPEQTPTPLPRNRTAPLYDCASVRVRTVIDNQEDLDVLLGNLRKLLPLLPSKHVTDAEITTES